MKDICKMLGIEKLNTTASHPQCNGAVERFNRTLKTMLRKQAATFGMQWDQYLSGVLWAYRNTPHSSTGEKPSFLLFGFDCRSPMEAALVPTKPLKPTNITDYREQMMLSLSSARKLAEQTNKEAQKRYKQQYDKTARESKIKVGDWVLIYFAQEETGKNRKLSQPWHGPYRVISQRYPDIVASKIYFPDDPNIQVHQSRVQHCPISLPAGFYWYGNKRSKPGRPPKHILKQLAIIEEELTQLKEKERTEQAASTSNDSSPVDSQKESITEPVPDPSRATLPVATQRSDTCPYNLRSRGTARDELSQGRR